MKQKVFICHSHADKERFVEHFARLLEMEGIPVWYDTWEIRAGDSISDKILAEGISKAKVLVVVISENSVKSDWVREELAHATLRRIQGKIRVIPVIIDNCKIPESVEHLSWIRISNLSDCEDSLSKIVNTIKGKGRLHLGRYITFEDKEKAKFARVRDEVNRILALEKAARFARLTPASFQEQLEGCNVGMSDKNWNIRFRNLLFATILVSRQDGCSIPNSFFEDEWLTPNAIPPLHMPWALAIVIIFGDAAQLKRIMTARIQLSSCAGSFMTTLSGKEHFVLNLLQGVRASLVAIDDLGIPKNKGLIFQVKQRFSCILDWIGDNHFDHIQLDEGGVRTRLLLSWADLIQIKRFFTKNSIPHEAANSTINKMLQQIKLRLTTEQIEKCAIPLHEAVNTASKLWENEMGTLHNQESYPLGEDETNPRIQSILAFLDTCVRTRTENSGVGWDTWREALLAFGEKSKYQHIRELAEFVKRRPGVQPFSSRN